MTPERKEEIKEMKERLRMMQQLQAQPAWKMFQDYVLKPLETQALLGAMEAKDPLQVGKHLGVLKVSKDLSSWCDREIEVTIAQIGALETAID